MPALVSVKDSRSSKAYTPNTQDKPCAESCAPAGSGELPSRISRLSVERCRT
jgi:hypothetical protein